MAWARDADFCGESDKEPRKCESQTLLHIKASFCRHGAFKTPRYKWPNVQKAEKNSLRADDRHDSFIGVVAVIAKLSSVSTRDTEGVINPVF
ncbi:hypothetical protein P5673_031249 [Acropora cervicornis]|uniref:Uncharacterized protein n=1 Tax=Acropora cervicornis TaxID=6130 RepID=A0AAD9PTG1_ACRCE|nr:hypothetical protein P5673_031249 [Acropora cervicornis]